MAKAKTYQWERGGVFISQKCDIPDCKNDVTHARFYYPTYMNGDAELMASLCEEHKEFKKYDTSGQIIEAYNSLIKKDK